MDQTASRPELTLATPLSDAFTLQSTSDHLTPEPIHPRAIYAALNSRPVTDKAQVLVSTVISQVLAHEQRTGKRKRHGSYADSHRRLTGAFLADLLRALGSPKASGWVFRSLKTETFSGSGDASHRRFKGLSEAMEGAGLLDVRKARAWGASRFPLVREDGTEEVQRYDDGSEQERSATRFRATAMLSDLFAAHGIEPSEARVHFLQALPENPVVLRGASSSTKGRKVKGPKLDAMKMPALAHLRDSLAVHEDALRRLNTFLDGFTYEGGVHRGYRRVFNLADDPEFAFNMGGRLYSQGEDAYQTMPKRKRRQMLIDGDEVVELDIRASFLSVLHGLNGLSFDARQDPYEVETLSSMSVGEDDMRRWAVKTWTVATLGHSQHFKRWPKRPADEFLKLTGKQLQSVYPINAIKEKMTEKFDILDRWGTLAENWAVLMAKEASAMFDTMTELMSHHSIPSLTVHDSLIVRRKDLAVARTTLERHYAAHCNILPYIPPIDKE